MERDSQTASYLVSTMTQLLMLGSIQRTVVLMCIALALLALPLAGTLHCEVAHNDQPASTPLADACCVFLCMSVLVSALVIQLTWVSITYTTFELKPVRLANRLTRWVPPPRPSGLLP
jgi:hypothetical protein